MTRKRKIAALAGMFLLAGLVAAGLAVGAAYEDSPFKKGPEFFLERMDERVEQLNLDKAQKARFQEIRAQVKKEMESSREEGREFFKNLKAELGKENPDMTTVAALIKAQTGRIETRVGMGVDRFLEFYGVLNPEQKEKVLAKAREHLDKPHHCPGRPGPWSEKTN